MNPTLIDTVELNEDDFALPYNRNIYKALIKLHEENKPIDIYTLGLELKKDNVRIQTLVEHWQKEAVDAVSNLSDYARRLREFTVMRGLLEAVEENDPVVALDKVDELQSKLQTEEVKNLEEVFYEYTAECEQRRLREGVLGVPTGLPTIDDSSPLEKGTLTILAARPSVGKSSFALSIARNAANSGARVLFVSIEMSLIGLMDRLMAMVTGREMSSIRKSMSDEPMLEAAETMSRLKDNLNFTYWPSATSKGICRLATQQHRRRPLDLVIVDYLQLLGDTRGKNTTNDIRIGQMTRALKVMAGKLGVAVVLLSQVNREAAREEGGMPKLHHLRDSGNIEQDSDIVLILNRKDKKDNYGELLIAKNRQGECDVLIPMLFNNNTTEFKEKVMTQHAVMSSLFIPDRFDNDKDL